MTLLSTSTARTGFRSTGVAKTTASVYALLLGSSLSLTSLPAHTQEKADNSVLETVVVTAQRREESLQEVPISISVLDQSQIDDRQITDISDLATYVPGLSVDATFGSGLGSFTIRGFSREARTTAAVAVYFADAVAPRGNTSQYSGDGAGPGSFFDLANVQVLRGPQGTLFGRNTTGGALLIVPQKPSDEVEGYVMAGAGNYNMKRAQGVLNLPVNDAVRLRFGMDTQKRDGYIENLSDRGPDWFNDVDYISARASMVIDLADNIENYSVFTYQDSSTKGDLVTMYGLGGGAGANNVVGGAIQDQADRYAAAGEWYAGENSLGNPKSDIRQWRFINTTQWDVSDNFTVKNIASYSDLETVLASAIFGSSFVIPEGIDPASGSYAAVAASFAPQGGRTTDHVTWSEEIQFLGETDNFQWQAGLYYERTTNEGLQGSMSPAFVDCGQDVRDGNCFDSYGYTFANYLGSLGALPPSVTYVPGRGVLNLTPAYVEYENIGAYAQGTYDFNEQLALTLGVRYTKDTSESYSQAARFIYNDPVSGDVPAAVTCQAPTHPNQVPAGFPATIEAITQSGYCTEELKQTSEEPTWLVNLDYKPTEDLLVYAKYVRGYRQGSINPAAPEGVKLFEPEQVDTYELGFKSEFGGAVPGRVNGAIFYNDFQDQQIGVGHTALPTSGMPHTSSIVNAGTSVIQGLELEAMLMPFEYFRFDVSYGYLDTEVKELTEVSNPDPALYEDPNPQAEEGEDLPKSPRHKVSATGTFFLPIPAEMGELSVGATYSYTSSMISAVNRPDVGSNDLVNLNANWASVGGSNFDLGLFVTNATDEEYVIHEGSQSIGANRRVGPPRMYGLSLRYNFGAMAR